MSRGPLERQIARRFLPFAAMGLAALATIPLPPSPTSWWLVGAAVALTIAISVAGLTVPWSRLPRSTFVLPALAYFVVIGLLREAQGGSTSGYAVLAILPIVWIALTLGRREVILGVLGGIALYVLPLAGVGSSTYTTTDWRRTILWIGMSLIVGLSIESLVRAVRGEAAEARKRADELAESERMLAAVAHVVREAASSPAIRDVVCRATLDVVGGAAATIVEPEGTDWLAVTGSAGLQGDHVRVRIGHDPSGSEIAFTTGRRLLVPDVRADPRSARRLAASAPEIVSALYEPITRNGRTVGVLAVGWTERVEALDSRRARAVHMLALEAGAVLERADLVALLQRNSLTDELTGLPNRRTWEEELPRALARARRTGEAVSVAMLDLDRFKDFNDSHGHLAGDELLQASARAWNASLRETDLLARYGGEEFTALLPDCDARSAVRVAERVRSATPRGQTCSIGVATWDGTETAAELLQRADAALYEAKRRGRNRVETAEAGGSVLVSAP